MFYFGFQDIHKSKLKNKREGAPQVKSKKGEEREREREGGRREDIKRKLQKSEEDKKIRRSATTHV
jgi:hypothetical protein